MARQISITLHKDEFEVLEERRGDSSRASFLVAAFRAHTGMPEVGRKRGRPLVTKKEVDMLKRQHQKQEKREAILAKFERVKGFNWANFDDPVQRALAIAAWSEQDRGDPPDPMPYRLSLDESPENSNIEDAFPDEDTTALWAWVDGYR